MKVLLHRYNFVYNRTVLHYRPLHARKRLTVDCSVKARAKRLRRAEKLSNLLMLMVGHAVQWKKILLMVAKDSENLTDSQ